jgi:hypothetical protein
MSVVSPGRWAPLSWAYWLISSRIYLPLVGGTHRLELIFADTELAHHPGLQTLRGVMSAYARNSCAAVSAGLAARLVAAPDDFDGATEGASEAAGETVGNVIDITTDLSLAKRMPCERIR